MVRKYVIAGPVQGIVMLFEHTRTGLVTEIQFTQIFHELVFQTMLGLEDVEDMMVFEEASKHHLLTSTNLPAC